MIDLLSGSQKIRQTSVYFTFARQVVHRLDPANDLLNSISYLSLYALGLVALCAAVAYALKN